ncbi:Xanthine dehydrogenase family protein, molybdopterin-binding subunit [Candidatus Sulfotelmatomonas gaucii]|uniref:Xanthine dehydrogenase family protein, molybdopterin-binding subunit n=1 Tax=Candidatus Sulfuritelmatomonas gaucii TaxID=2043161 RepID=A0A2N9LI68_9BACT|nr:Xanthine dehydrogenase family protein, molybdopterin-binding subunit [Candidatus Sulfotelmatomonas gaucii]
MFQFTLNGAHVSTDANKNLMEYLREDAHLTSVKDGCDEGVCGSCSVIVNGKAVRACTHSVAKVNGKSVITAEGLSARERDVYGWAFGEVGAVQCGFCMPGMVMSAKALLDANLAPTEADVKRAIRYNVCRCTGYVKIERAIQLAAHALRSGETHLAESAGANVGERTARAEAKEKLLGTGEFVDDLRVPGMLFGAVLRAKYPRALLRKIEIAPARAVPGVEAVLTAKDMPGERLLGHVVHDWPVMIAEGEETRYVGDAIALVAAKTKAAAREAVDRIRVEYEEREPVLSPQAAMADGAPRLHPGGNLLATTVLKRGDVDCALAEAAHVVTQHYSTPRHEHAFLEPESALAVPEPGGSMTVYTAGQGVYDDRREIVRMLGVADEKVRVISKYVGGGFGGKEDMSVQHHAALLAWRTGKPVKLTFSRAESMRVHPKRHPMEMEYTTACDKNGKLTAVRVRIVADTGAYASLGGPVLQRACTHAAGPYQIDNVDIEGRAIYTNNIPSGAMRGFGVTQTCFAMESNLNLLAVKVGISPWEIRFRNAIEPAGVLSNGQIADGGTALKETLLAVKDVIDAHPDAGIACAFKNTGKGVGVNDVGRVKLRVDGGRVVICTSAACMGQGIATVLLQMVAETAGLNKSLLAVHCPDTSVTPDSGTSTASRQTTITGEAARRAASALKQELNHLLLAELDGHEFLGEYDCVTDPMTCDKPNPVSHVAYGYATQVVILDNQGKVQKVIAAHDVGRAINPNGVEGQIEGGVVMGMGYALTEEFPLRNGAPAVTFGRIGLLRSTQTPEIECRIIEKNQSELACGAKGVGEIVSIPTAPAIACAYWRRDGKLRTRLPLKDTPYSRNPLPETTGASEDVPQPFTERAASRAAD